MGSINDWAGINLNVRGTFRGGETGDVLLQASHLHRWMILHWHSTVMGKNYHFTFLLGHLEEPHFYFQQRPIRFGFDICTFVSAMVGLGLLDPKL